MVPVPSATTVQRSLDAAVRNAVLAALLAVLLLTVAAATPAPAVALERSTVGVDTRTPRVSLSPPRIVESMRPGESRQVEVRISNYTDRRFEGVVARRDLEASEHPGSFVRSTNRDPKAAGRWLTPEVSRISLEPGERVAFRVSVKVPDAARPGTHAAGIVVSERLEGRRGGVAVDVQATLVSQFVITVPGQAATDAHIESVSGPRLVHWGERPDFTAIVANDGDTLITANGEVGLPSFLGMASQRLPFAETLVFPGGTRTVTSRWAEVPWFGWFRPTITVTSEAGTETAAYPMVFVVPPWWLIAIVVATLALPLVSRWRNRERQDDLHYD